MTISRRCCWVLVNENMKPRKLQMHLETKHQEIQTQEPQFFPSEIRIKVAKKVMSKGAASESLRNIICCSHANCKWQTSTYLLLPAAKDICRIIMGEQGAKALKTIPISNNTIPQSSDDLAENIQDQLIEQAKKSQ
ncbi:unnamed protein product [Natator depressus]